MPRLIDFIRGMCIYHKNDEHQQDLVKVIGAAVRVLSLMLRTSVEKEELCIVAGFLMYTADQLRMGGIALANAAPLTTRHKRSSSVTQFPFFNSPPVKSGLLHGGIAGSNGGTGQIRKLSIATLMLDKERCIAARHQILHTLIDISRKASKSDPTFATITLVVTPQFLLQMLEALVTPAHQHTSTHSLTVALTRLCVCTLIHDYYLPSIYSLYHPVFLRVLATSFCICKDRDKYTHHLCVGSGVHHNS